MCRLCDGDPVDHSRRRVLGIAGLALASVAVAGPLTAIPGIAAAAPNAIGPDAALERIRAGNARYVAQTPVEQDFSAAPAARAQAPYPIASILGPAHFRLAPDLLSHQAPADLFS